MPPQALNSPFHFDDVPFLHPLKPWAKRKRSRRPPLHASPSEEEYLALCLIMLARGDPRSLLEPAVATKSAFKCPLRDKVFSSYQALGGHKTSHRKPAACDDQCMSISGATSTISNSGGRAHVRNVCHKSLPTGQALGRHKRCYYEDGADATANRQSYNGMTLTSSEEVGSTHIVSHSHRNFDLNIPALPILLPKPSFPGDEEVESPLPMKKPRFLWLPEPEISLNLDDPFPDWGRGIRIKIQN
ncbi:zinc finger protein ZAT10-like [Cucurbita moschata]|uniref:Zinc finger protein ZAT10-like n=1 Tax=Cucurbita moschata TaxID=3662 RepID=A0A6J1HGS7_CUCMO|nr:zinc finger protein ZAT10-like [Cucurbita moschata]